MATDKPRFTITLSDEMYAHVSAYKAEHRISTQSKAIQNLIAVGIKTVEEKNNSNVNFNRVYAKTEESLLDSWRKADERAKEDVGHALRDFGFSYERKKEKEA